MKTVLNPVLPFLSVKCNCYRLTGERIFTGPQFSKAYLHKHTGKLRWFDFGGGKATPHFGFVITVSNRRGSNAGEYEASTWLILKI